MHICFFTENFNKGGLDTFLINLINFWPDSGDKLTIYCNANHPGIETLIEKTGGRVVIKKYKRFFLSETSRGYSRFWKGQLRIVKKLFGGAYRLLRYPILFPWYVISLTFLFRRSQFNRLMVVNGGYPGSLLCQSAAIAWRVSGKKLPCIFNIHSSASMPPKLIAPFENAIDQLLIASSKCFICVSKNSVEFLRNRKTFFNSNQIEYIYNGIADPIDKSSATTDAITISVPPYILMLATLDQYKGHKFLLKSFQQVIKVIPNVQLKMFGHGSEEQKKYIQNEILKLGLSEHVLLGDFVTNPNALIANASIMAAPSQNYEAFGLTIIEAMAHKIPIVATNVGGMPEVLEGSNAGFICNKNDYEEFAHHMIEILGNPVLAEKLGANGRKTFEQRFNAVLMAKQYHSIITSH